MVPGLHRPCLRSSKWGELHRKHPTNLGWGEAGLRRRRVRKMLEARRHAPLVSTLRARLRKNAANSIATSQVLGQPGLYRESLFQNLKQWEGRRWERKEKAGEKRRLGGKGVLLEWKLATAVTPSIHSCWFFNEQHVRHEAWLEPFMWHRAGYARQEGAEPW